MLLLNPSLTAGKIQKSMGMCIREQHAENSFFPRHATLADLRLRKRGPTFLFWKVGLAPRPGRARQVLGTMVLEQQHGNQVSPNMP